MAFIKVISPNQASGRLKKLYQQVRAPDGQVDNVLQIHSLRPHTLAGHMAIYKAVLHHTGNLLAEWYLEAIGVLVSRLNGCAYCASHHEEGMKRLLDEEGKDVDAYVRALQSEPIHSPFTAREIGGLSYAQQLTRAPGTVSDNDIKQLRDAGFDDGEILEINQVTAYFAYANRTVTGLGVNTQNEVLGQSPPTGGDDSGWSHG